MKASDFAGVNLRPIFPVISGKLGFPGDHPMLEHFQFVANNTSVLPKISIPGPSCCHFRVALEDIHPQEYEDLNIFVRRYCRRLSRCIERIL